MTGNETVVGASTHITGNLQGEEDLRVIGRVDGNIELQRTLYVEPDGVVVADVQVARAVISGTLVGNVTATELVHIAEDGRVVGDITAPRVVLVDGASFRGNVDMGDLDAPRDPELRRRRATSARPRAAAKSEELAARPGRASFFNMSI